MNTIFRRRREFDWPDKLPDVRAAAADCRILRLDRWGMAFSIVSRGNGYHGHGAELLWQAKCRVAEAVLDNRQLTLRQVQALARTLKSTLDVSFAQWRIGRGAGAVSRRER